MKLSAMYIPGQAKYEPGTKCRASVLDKKLPTWERENGYAKKRIFGPKSKMEMPKSNIILDLSKKYAAKKMPKSIIVKCHGEKRCEGEDFWARM